MIKDKNILFYIKIFFIGAFILVLLLGVFAQFSNKQTVIKLSPTPSFLPPFIKTEIGKTTEKDISKLPILEKSTSPNGINTYKIESISFNHPDEIITKNGVVVFERTSTFTNQSGGFPKLSLFLNNYGKPEEEIKGSRSYGPFVITYIYTKRGFAIIGYPESDTVYEVQRFLPTTVEEYKKQYGKDIKPGTPPPEG